MRGGGGGSITALVDCDAAQGTHLSLRDVREGAASDQPALGELAPVPHAPPQTCPPVHQCPHNYVTKRQGRSTLYNDASGVPYFRSVVERRRHRVVVPRPPETIRGALPIRFPVHLLARVMINFVPGQRPCRTNANVTAAVNTQQRTAEKAHSGQTHLLVSTS